MVRSISESLSAVTAQGVPPISAEHVLKAVAVSGTAIPLSGKASSTSVSFRLLSEIGQGGMGVVYRAQQDYPSRVVALKVMKTALAGSTARERFEREINILARLQHRGIAQLHAAGMLEDGTGAATPYMAMEFVQGLPLVTYSQAHHLSVIARVDLMLKVCQIVAYAHGQSVVHRDLKPSNILVDEWGEPKVLDFGLATIDEQAGKDVANLTVQGQMVGTLDYMSPEQASGKEAVDQQSDVYALGVLMYELLVFKRPFDFSRCSLIEAVQTIQQSDPPRLSSASRAYRGDLEIIVQKAMTKEKSRRYQTVEQLAEDLRRFLAHEPIRARHPGMGYRISKFVERNRKFVAAVTLIIMALSMGLVLAELQAIRANAEAARANAANLETQRELHNAQLQMAHRQVEQGKALLLAKRFIEARDSFNEAWDAFDRLHEPGIDAQLGIWELDTQSARPIRVVEPVAGNIQGFAISADGNQLALGYNDGHVEVRDVVTNAVERRLVLPRNAMQVEFSPDGHLLLAVTTNCYSVWDLRTGEAVRDQVVIEAPIDLVQLRDDRLIYVRSDDWILRQESIDGSKEMAPPVALKEFQPRALVVTDKGVEFISHDWHFCRVPLDGSSVTELRDLGFNQDYRCALSPNARTLAVVRQDDTVLIDLTSGEEKTFKDDGGDTPVGFIDEHTWYVGKQDSSLLLVMDLEGKIINQLPISRMTRGILRSDFALIAENSGNVKLWSIAPSRGLSTLVPVGNFISCATLSSDGWIAAVAFPDGSIHLFDTIVHRELGRLDCGGKVNSVAFSDDTMRLAALVDMRRVQFWNVPRCEKEVEIIDADNIQCFAFGHRGDIAASSIVSQNALIFYRRNGPKWEREQRTTPVLFSNLAFSQDDQTLLALDSNGKGSLQSILSPDATEIQLEQTANLQGPVAYVSQCESLVARSNSLLKMWDAKNGHLLKTFQIPSAGSFSVSRGGILAFIDSSSLFWNDINRAGEDRQIPLEHGGYSRVALNGSALKVLIWGRTSGAILIDFSFATKMRPAIDQDAPAAFWFVSANIAAHALPDLKAQAPRRMPLEDAYTLGNNGSSDFLANSSSSESTVTLGTLLLMRSAALSK